MCKRTVSEHLQTAGTLIEGLPGVLRVGVDIAARQIEILFQYPSVGLLREIYAVLDSANSEVVASKVC